MHLISILQILDARLGKLVHWAIARFGEQNDIPGHVFERTVGVLQALLLSTILSERISCPNTCKERGFNDLGYGYSLKQVKRGYTGLIACKAQKHSMQKAYKKKESRNKVKERVYWNNCLENEQ